MPANVEVGTGLTERVSRALWVMRFTKYTGPKRTPFALHHGRKPRTELTSIVKNSKPFFSDWSVTSVLPPTTQTLGSRCRRRNNNIMVMARTKVEEKQLNKGPKSSKKEKSVRYSFKTVEKNHEKNHWWG